jgi:hypothetical protein
MQSNRQFLRENEQLDSQLPKTQLPIHQQTLLNSQSDRATEVAPSPSHPSPMPSPSPESPSFAASGHIPASESSARERRRRPLKPPPYGIRCCHGCYATLSVCMISLSLPFNDFYSQRLSGWKGGPTGPGTVSVSVHCLFISNSTSKA